MLSGYRVAEMCDRLDCSERYLHHVFVEDLGISPADWLQTERMVDARHRLREGATPAEVADKLGFSSTSSFGRLFKATYEISARSYQEQERERMQL